ncbi:MAG: hypothetical protein ACLSD4_05020 [Bifidobacterium catenulatum]
MVFEIWASCREQIKIDLRGSVICQMVAHIVMLFGNFCIDEDILDGQKPRLTFKRPLRNAVMASILLI